MCDLLYTTAEDVVKRTYYEHSRSTNEQKDVDVTTAEDVVKKTYSERSRSTNEQKDVDVTSSKTHANYVTRDRECLRAGKMNKQQKNIMSMAGQTSVGKYSTTLW